ncbi:hypothetical protein B296_00043792 [Ensete ventricosum]|uniref:RING-type domain-containing protein n=1 Tax=Ensete ventricosum TaxID=4639 RepID=A0A426XKD9_ENSVE|nr:hypothetical protein B296_00043792 [Ensete ventricosum]
MEGHLCAGRVGWDLFAKLKEGRPASESSRLSAPVVMKLRYSVLHFHAGQVMQEQPCPYHYVVFNLGEFLHHDSRRQAISSVLFRLGTYGYGYRGVWQLEQELFAFCNDPVESALRMGAGIEITVGLRFYRYWIGTEPSFDEGVSGDGGFGGVPASSDAVKELAVVKYQREGDVREHSCMICFEEFHVWEEVTQMPCKHAFHGGCLTRWLASSHLCPICRYAIAASARP